MQLKQQGFSLIEALIGVAVLGALSLGLMTMFSNAFKQESALNAKQESRTLFDELALTFINSDSCGIRDVGALGSLDPNSKNEIEITEGLIGLQGKVISKDGNGHYGKLKLSDTNSITISPLTNMGHLMDSRSQVDPALVAQAGSYVKIGTSNNYSSEIRLRFKKPAGADNNQGLIILRFPVILTLDHDNGNKITSCRSIPEVKHAQESCQSIDGGNSLSAEWDEEEFSCKVSVNSNDADGGLCNPDHDCTNGSSINKYRTSSVLN